MAAAFGRVGLALGGLGLLGVLLTACGSDDGAALATPDPSAAVPSDLVQSDEPLEIPGVPAPSATLTAPPVPRDGSDVATTRPATYPQFVPPDLALSGVAVAVSSTEAERGQIVQFAAQAAPELAGHTAYLVTAFDASAKTLASGAVGADGRFVIGFEVRDTTDVVVVVAQAGVPADAPYNFDDIVARSEVIRILRI